MLLTGYDFPMTATRGLGFLRACHCFTEVVYGTLESCVKLQRLSALSFLKIGPCIWIRNQSQWKEKHGT